MNILDKFLLAACLLLSSAAAGAQEQPGLWLTTFSGDNSISHAAGDPLLITVVLENSAAKVISRRNQRHREILDKYAATDEYKSLDQFELSELNDAYPIRDVPEFQLGSASVAVSELIDFQIRDADGTAKQVPVRLLASNDRTHTSITLEAESSRDYQFAFESSELQKLADGTYQLVAVIDTREQTDMWSGWVYSQPITINLVRQQPDPDWPGSNLRSLMVSTYLIADQQFAEAEKHAQEWTTRDPESVDAWAQLGEALFGQGENSLAVESFNTALAKFRAKFGNRPVELPEQITDRLNQIESTQQ